VASACLLETDLAVAAALPELGADAEATVVVVEAILPREVAVAPAKVRNALTLSARATWSLERAAREEAGLAFVDRVAATGTGAAGACLSAAALGRRDTHRPIGLMVVQARTAAVAGVRIGTSVVGLTTTGGA